MELLKSINVLSALAQESRLLVFKQLVQAGPEGMQPFAISKNLNMPAATLSFHLKELFQADLIIKNKQGRAIFYSAKQETMTELIDYIQENCCQGHPIPEKKT